MNKRMIERGRAMLEMNKTVYAIDCLVKAGATDPSCWEELGRMFWDGDNVEKDKARARSFFRKAREVSNKNRQLRIRGARLRLRKTRFLSVVNARGCAA